jgi:hypothetical protein
MRRLLTCGIIVCLVAFVATSVLAAARQNLDTRERPGWVNGSKGTWCTGEITEPEYATRWGYGATDQGHINIISADEATKQVGSSSIKLYTETGFDTWVYFPNTRDLDLDCAQIGSISFLLFTENKNGWGGDIWVILRDMDDRQVTYRSLHGRLYLTLTQWVPYAVPVGPEINHPEIVAAYGWKAEAEKDFDWAHLACVEVHADTGGYGFDFYLDDMRFNARGTEPAKWWRSSLDKPDLAATYAERLPRYPRNMLDYSQTYPLIRPEGQNIKHWPDEGETVQWIVHVRNEGFEPSPASDLVCTVDGKEIFRAPLKPMKAKTETTVAVPWKWENGAHQLVVTLDTPGNIDEITKLNNTLELQTNAYTLFAVVEKACAAKVAQVTNRYGSFSFEDWLRGSTVDHMNWMMANSTYDFAPNGAPCRVRVDKIVYVDSIKDMPESEKPGEEIDGGWYYPEVSWIEYCNLATTYMWALDHELTHQLGIVDDYQMDLGADKNMVNGKGFGQPDGGSMGGGRTNGRGGGYYADMDIAGFIATYGCRRGYFGEYLWCVPDTNAVQILIGDQPLRNAEITVYQKKWDEGHGRDTTGNGTIPNTPIMQGTTDDQGRYTFENRPVLKEYTTDTGCTLKPNPFGYIDVVARNGLLMLRANVDGTWYYGFMDIGLFNVEYARGHKDHGQYKLELKPEEEPAKQ